MASSTVRRDSSPAFIQALRRRLSAVTIDAPMHLRALVRTDELWLAALAILVGVLAGIAVFLMDFFSHHFHFWFFDLAHLGEGLSQQEHIEPIRAIFVPILGGAVLGSVSWLLAKYRPGNFVDPVEANALYGGKLSLRDSVIVAAQTVMSNGVGGSVGMEAGYAQFGGGLASWVGRQFRLRRNDLRILVGCGAGAAIGAAFNAPLCGAFYGIELVIGTYSMTSLPLIIVSTLTGTLVAEKLLHGGVKPLDVVLPNVVPGYAYPLAILLGVTAGFTGIAIMRGVTTIEAGFRRTGVPIWLRPILGGVVVGLLGSITPKVMASGNSSLHTQLAVVYPFLLAMALLLMKSTASAFSIGSGFRGGLFFAALFMGSLLGRAYGDLAIMLPFAHGVPIGFYAVVGMAALAVAIVGGPMTMTFLALESTNNFSITVAVLAAAIAASLTVRRVFGYSFTTWRFHLRGESIRSAVDIGWIHNLTVGRMMRRPQYSVRDDTEIATFKTEYPLGRTQYVVAVDAEERYVGLAYPSEAHAPGEEDPHTIHDLVRHQNDFLLPQATVKEAIRAFERAECDVLAVLDGPETRHVLGVLTEQYALRRYSEELDQRRRELSGE
ncbi:chloride channel protein [Acidiphilium sp. AL]|uniref:Chloride channel protein n=1 Tax=Acidiphilium iwatense TaxID=768198 RepID=A0ABS9DTW6_9PROT|nr:MULTISPECIES: chloride channel protein [Acidiphilium]MCF3946168.1 chloride channel protein [Acidiphilium iwatense]MCU4158512.1 chloride channel protein [Acidiphilium sp. AL]